MVTTRSSTKRKSIDDAPEPEPQTLPASTPKRRRLPLRKKTAGTQRSEIPDTDNDALSAEDDEGAEADETLDLDAALQAQVAAQNPDTPVLPAAEARWGAAAEEEEEEQESDDEAPEAVSNVQAASRARDAAEAMKKAAREEANKLRQKRKDRDARLKEQADLRKAKEPSPQPVPAADTAAPEDVPLADKLEEAAPADKPTQEAPASIKFDGALLPDEFLASDSEEEQPDGPAPKRRKANKQKTKPSEPRDKRAGVTVYRVMKGKDTRAAPKAEVRSKLVRDNLMQRGREGKKKKGGFIVGSKRVDWGTSRKC